MHKKCLKKLLLNSGIGVELMSFEVLVIIFKAELFYSL